MLSICWFLLGNMFIHYKLIIVCHVEVSNLSCPIVVILSTFVNFSPVSIQS
jgi:hypothetical protein